MTVRFYFDFVSPYAYVAWTQMPALCARHGRALEPVPVLFAGLLGAHGTRGPAEVPAKRAYVFRDAYRKAHKLGLPPLVPPPSHPFNPLAALRACTIDLPQDDRRRLIDALFAATWAGGGGVETQERVAAIASSVGFDGAAIVARAGDKNTKDRLRAATDEAIAAGVFGVPTAVERGEIFWGVDALPLLEDRLMGRDPIDHAGVERWASLPASTQRSEAAQLGTPRIPQK